MSSKVSIEGAIQRITLILRMWSKSLLDPTTQLWDLFFDRVTEHTPALVIVS
jgi:hypothetical protein